MVRLRRLQSMEGSLPPPLLQVGSRAGAPAVGGGFPVPLFRSRNGFTFPPWPRFQPPPRQTQRAAFPHCAFLFASCQGLGDLSCWERFQPWSVHPVVVEQAQALIQPLPTPPLPPAAPPLPCTHQMPSDLLFHPIFDKTKASTGVTHRKVPNPAPQDRINQRNHPIDGLRLEATEYLLQLPYQCRALLQPRRIPRPPDGTSTLHPPEVKTQEAELLPLGQVNDPAFLLMDGDLEGRQFLPEAYVYGLEEPVMLWIGIHQDHEIIREPGLLEVGVGTTTGDLFRPLQHLIHHGEIQITE